MYGTFCNNLSIRTILLQLEKKTVFESALITFIKLG